jgi:hypothetical protein
MTDRTSLLVIPADEELPIQVVQNPNFTNPTSLWETGTEVVQSGTGQLTLIERVRPINIAAPWLNDDRWRLWVNEDGMNYQLPLNPRACRLYRGCYQMKPSPILGNACLVSYDGGEDDYGLTESEAAFWSLWLKASI